MLEDVQLRCQLAAERMAEALALGDGMRGEVPAELAKPVAMNLDDLARFRRRAVAYACHLRNEPRQDHAQVAGEGAADTGKDPGDLLAVLQADQQDQAAEKAVAGQGPRHKPKPGGTQGRPAIGPAIELLKQDPDRFLKVYFLDSPDSFSRGPFSVTSP